MLSPEELAEASARETIWNPVPVRRCKTCQLWRPEAEFDTTGVVGRAYLRRECRACTRKRMRDHYAANRAKILERRRRRYAETKSDPITVATRRRTNREAQRRRRARARVDAATAQKLREWRLRYRQKRDADPARRQAYLEGRRISDSLRRRAAGAPARPETSKLKLVDSSRTMLEVAPFREWLADRIEVYGGQGTLASLIGLPERTLYRIMFESQQVDLRVVDQALTKEGSTALWELYPELTETGRAAA